MIYDPTAILWHDWWMDNRRVFYNAVAGTTTKHHRITFPMAVNSKRRFSNSGIAKITYDFRTKIIDIEGRFQTEA